MKITKLVIDENRWLRAGWRGGLDSPIRPHHSNDLPKHLTADSSLLDKKTKRMCCLGFASCAAGVSQKDITNIDSPAGLKLKERAKIAKKFPWLFQTYGGDSTIAMHLMEINDDPIISLPKKRAKIKEIFKKNGVAVIFKR
jgi:hypothetical protein